MGASLLVRVPTPPLRAPYRDCAPQNGVFLGCAARREPPDSWEEYAHYHPLAESPKPPRPPPPVGAPAESRQGGAGVLVSYDSGRSWEARGHVRLASTWLIENTVQHVAETDDILMLFRTGSGAVFASRSSDDGRSWSQAAATSLPNPNSKLGMTTCSWHPAAAAPCLAVAYNHSTKCRAPLHLALSYDHGGVRV